MLSSRERIWGGGEVFLADLAEALRGLGHEIVMRVEQDSQLALRCGLAVVRRDRPQRYDLLIANDFRSVWQSLLLDGLRHRIFVAHGDWQLSPVRIQALQLWRVRSFVVSASVADHAVRLGMHRRPPVLPLGPARVHDRTCTPTPPATERWTVGTVARLDPLKRLELFGAVANELGAPAVVTVPPGKVSGPESAILAALDRPGIEVHRDGNAAHVWKDADVFLSTSLRESLGLAHLEALAHGLPVLSTAAGGPADYLVGPLQMGALSEDDPVLLAAQVRAALAAVAANWQEYWDAVKVILAARGPEACARMLLDRR